MRLHNPKICDGFTFRCDLPARHEVSPGLYLCQKHYEVWVEDGEWVKSLKRLKKDVSCPASNPCDHHEQKH
jgi:hypothetical protein